MSDEVVEDRAVPIDGFLTGPEFCKSTPIHSPPSIFNRERSSMSFSGKSTGIPLRDRAVTATAAL